MGRVIGFGGFGTTYLAWDTTMQQVRAIKEYLPSVFATRNTETTRITVYGGVKAEQFEKGRKQFLEEARKLAKFTEYESIVDVYDFIEENGTSYIVMEYVDGETLKDILKRETKMSFEDALRIVEPILNALQGVHREGIVHRDIAPDNIKITSDGKVKLLDFGAAREATANHSHSLSVIYKQGYAPEEQFQSRGEQGAWTDVYALAATFYHMITGEKPIPSLERLVKDTLKAPSEMGVKLTKNQENALLNALNVRHERRTQTAETFLNELKSSGVVERVAEVEAQHKPDQKENKKSIRKFWVGIALILLIIGGGVFAFGKTLGVFRNNESPETEQVRVPSFVNYTWEYTQELAKETGLKVEVVGVEYSRDIEKDLVLRQNVKGGSMIEKDKVVEVVLSGGVKQIVMKNVEGMEMPEALKLLEELGFIVEKEEVFSTVEKDCVISFDMEPGKEYDEGTKVVLVVSKGPDQSETIDEFLVQNYVGEDVESIQARLKDSGAVLNVEKEYSEEVEAGRVISQKEAPGTRCKIGSTITLVVSMGKETVEVPICVNLDSKKVEKELLALGLKMAKTESYSSSVAAGKVISQIPEKGTAVNKGDTVEVVVSKGKKPANTPTKAPTPTKAVKATATPVPTQRVLSYGSIRRAKVGNYVAFGTYEQDGKTNNKEEAIEWEVMAVEEDRVLLLSRYCLDAISYNEESENITWSESSLREWLGGKFYINAFSSTEQMSIISTELDNANNEKFGTLGGEPTSDKVFVLSKKEVDTYFGTDCSDSERKVKATKYAQKQNVEVDGDGNCDWWLRTPGEYSSTAMTVQQAGNIKLKGYGVQMGMVGVRPAIWVKK